MSLRFVMFACCAALLSGADYKGVIRSNGLPIPGAAVTARQGSAEHTIYTGEDGRYEFPDLTGGVWRIHVEMFGFQPADREVRDGEAGDFDLKLRPAPAALRTAPGQQGFEQVAVVERELQAALTEPTREPVEMVNQDANESFLVNGSLSRGLQDGRRDDPFLLPRSEPGAAEAGPFAQAGDAAGRGRRAGGAPPGPPGGRGPGRERGAGRERGGRERRARDRGRDRNRTVFGNRAGRGRDTLRGQASFTSGGSAFDATPYSISGQAIGKPSYSQARFGIGLGGMLRIPKLLTDERTFFFMDYRGRRGRNPFDNIATMPGLPERGGDFRSGPPIYDPLGNLPFAGNLVPLARQSAAARGLLELFPVPNLPGAVQNYQILAGVPRDSDDFSLRLGRGLGTKDRLSGTLALQRRDAADMQLYGFRDFTGGGGLNTSVTWNHTLRARLLTHVRFAFSRNTNTNTPFFSFGRNWAGDLGIGGTSNDPLNYGPPNLSFTNIGDLRDGNPANRRDQSAAIAPGMTYIRRNHNLSFGGEYRRTQINNLSQQNARGTMTFSGLATSALDESGQPLAGTGYDFADFLLGRPQSTSIRFGNPDTYFRGAQFSAYSQDDWRVSPGFTLNIGVRYEALRPMREKYGRIANLDIAPGFLGVAPVTPGVAGPYTGAFPQALVETDWNNFSPRMGFAFRPSQKRPLVVRGAYGWYYNGPVSNQAAFRLAQQPPFAQTGTLNTTLARPLTIEGGFSAVPTGRIANTYAVDRYYRVGYAQTWSLSVQHELPHALVAEIGYLGTKGTRLDIQRLPNRAAPGSPLTAEDRRLIGNAVGFTFDSSDGNSIYHAAQGRLSRRFRGGVAVNALYTYGKSIDNASTLGGGGAVVAQNDRDLRAERGLSSFDRRHTLNVNYMFSTSARRGGGSRLHSAAFRDWTLSGSTVIRSGSPFTAQVLGNRSDQGGTGVVGSGRADATGLAVSAGAGFFNRLAFAIPPPGRFGNAGRNTIPGPGFFAMNLSLARAIPFGDSRRSMEIRLEADNLLNSVNITRIGAVVNAVNYGWPLNAGRMRQLQAHLRIRF
jgi:hypothetical protein